MFRRSEPAIPDGVPILARGSHRNPRKGACFMEMASYLAGERWSDHPKCTHPLLASIARCINDAIDDDARQQLPELIPEVVGLNPSDPRVVPVLVRAAALAALPVAAHEIQHVMALAVLTTERTLATIEGRPLNHLSRESREALSSVPASEQWARRFIRGSGVKPGPIKASAATTVTSLAISGIAHACVPDTDARLVDLLRSAIDEARALMPIPMPMPMPEQSTPTPTASRSQEGHASTSRWSSARS